MYPADHFPPTQDLLGTEDLPDVFQIRGPGNPTDVLTERKSDMLPLPPILGCGA